MTDKPKYTFVVNTMISLHIDVEAETLEEAVELAQEAPTMSLCHHCARTHKSEWSTSGEIDGDPAGSKLVDFLVDDDEARHVAVRHGTGALSAKRNKWLDAGECIRELAMVKEAE